MLRQGRTPTLYNQGGFQPVFCLKGWSPVHKRWYWAFKDPSQRPPFSTPSKLLILHGEAKSLPSFVFLKVCLIIFSSFTVISFVSTCQYNLTAKLLHLKKKTKEWLTGVHQGNNLSLIHYGSKTCKSISCAACLTAPLSSGSIPPSLDTLSGEK